MPKPTAQTTAVGGDFLTLIGAPMSGLSSGTLVSPLAIARTYGYVQFVMASQFGGSGATSVSFSVDYYDFLYPNTGFHQRTQATGISLTLGQPLTWFVYVPDGATLFDLTWTATSNVGAGSSVSGNVFGWTVEPGTNVASTAPPVTTYDSALMQQLAQAVQLIQRQAVPFAYVFGELDSGLSGQGSIGVQGLLGVAVQFTTIPTAIGSEDDDPRTYFDLGWIAFGTADGYQHHERLLHNPQLILPSRMSAVTTIAYSLAPGAVANIQQIVREA